MITNVKESWPSAISCFHIPFRVGSIKAFVTTTPVEGGSIMRVKTFIDYRVRYSIWRRIIAWLYYRGCSRAYGQHEFI